MSVKNKITVHAYKYNGTLYRSWEFPTVINKTDEYICVSSQNCKVITYLEDEKRFVYSKLTRPTI
jgi:protein associated with RNAse G/E